jgi:hypothetical protein
MTHKLISLLATPLALSAALLLGGCAAPPSGGASASPASAAAVNTSGIASIEGSTWGGTDSDGDYYEFTFLKGGQLRYGRREAGKLVMHQDAGDYWGQSGDVVIITTTKFSTRQGLIKGNRMQGDAWNVRGDRWTWVGDKR